MIYTFIKMHGLGNDFIFLDYRTEPFNLTKKQIQHLCHRRFGIGCDQLIVLEKPQALDTDVFMRIFNADGTEAGACGNATRCLGLLLTQQTGKPNHTVQTLSGLLSTHTNSDQLVTVDMGKPSLNWKEIPLSQEMNTLYLPISSKGLEPPAAVSMGNPHLVFFSKTLEKINLEALGEELSHHPLFPQGTNVEIVKILDRHKVQMRVYERGTGITLACASGACAVVVAGKERGLLDSPVQVLMEGGALEVSYDQTVQMQGTVHFTFHGTFDPQLLVA